jgi:hypothetical protein
MDETRSKRISAMDLQSARRFISNHGDPSEQARLRYLTLHAPPSPPDREALFAGQRRDGGWPPLWDSGYSSVDATCLRLAQSWQLGLGNREPEIARALHFLAERQASLGSWEEDASEVAVAPSWAAPGELSARLYLTASCAYWIALLHADNAPAKLASSFLLSHLSASGHMPSFPQAHWLAAGLWTRLGQKRPAEKIFSHLSEGLSGLSPGACAWMIASLRQAGVPASLDLIQEALTVIATHQEPDGRWSSEDGPGRDVHATLEALYALSLCR